MNRPILLSLVATLLFVSSSDAACLLRLRVVPPVAAGERVKLQWDAIAGAVEYHVYESVRGLFDQTRTVTKKTTFEITHRVTSDTTFFYTVLAIIDPSVASISDVQDLGGCVATTEAVVTADPALRRFSRRAIIPVAGSGPGAKGALFKTSLRMTSTGADQRGQLFFRPAGKVASDGDPAIRYSFGLPGEITYYDDVVTAMGATGIGSIDIVPDADADAVVPDIEVRLFNETPEGTFGTFGEAVYPFDYLRAPGLRVQVPDNRFRLNLGLRTLSRVHMRAFIFANARGGLLGFVDRDFAADVMLLLSAEELLGSKLQPGHVLEIGFEGSVIPFYTVTENATNDPTLVIATPRKSNNVGAYVD